MPDNTQTTVQRQHDQSARDPEVTAQSDRASVIRRRRRAAAQRRPLYEWCEFRWTGRGRKDFASHRIGVLEILGWTVAYESIPGSKGPRRPAVSVVRGCRLVKAGEP